MTENHSGANSQTKLRRAAKVANSALVPKGVGLAVGQLGRSRQNLSEAWEAARETRQRLLNESKLPIKTVILKDGSEHELPTDPSERFEFLYRVMDWSPAHHASQITAARRAKYGSIAMTIIAFAMVCFMIFTVPMWIAFLLIPTSLTVLAVGIATTFRWALVEYQYTQRALINFKTFLVQPNFFRWIFC
ncbi:hypothetical protein [Variovorax sp. RA8]|uniref:hypothetical protein n=1 Tax=Variovorax sp. (strain JCM 16519 / RA8) TaxID=662548 RepID=UPI000AAC941E|nr:hypothetical protein [Variovorax sp. RA8]VTU44957.1 hypothetical protein RA8P2_00393 [Variovorax sp. RA8]